MLYHTPCPSELFWHYSKTDFMSSSDYPSNSLRFLNLDIWPVHSTQQLWSLIQTEINTACNLYIPKFKVSSRKPRNGLSLPLNILLKRSIPCVINWSVILLHTSAANYLKWNLTLTMKCYKPKSIMNIPWFQLLERIQSNYIPTCTFASYRRPMLFHTRSFIIPC